MYSIPNVIKNQINMNSTRLHLRLQLEIQEARNAGFDIQEEILHPSSHDVLSIVVHMNFIGRVTVRFSVEHPFKPPKITINGRCMHEAMMFRDSRLNNRYSDISGGECICCDMKFMGSKWAPSLKLRFVLESIRDMQEKRHYVRYEKAVHSIHDKFNIPDELPIMEYVGRIETR